VGAGKQGTVFVKILCILTYYRPHVSGLTIYVERLARALAVRGHQVTVLTSRYDGRLPREEMLDGVRVVRVPVAVRLNKGVVMPSFPFVAWREIRSHDVVSIHLPQVEGALATLLARGARRKPVITYHCDLQMPPAWYGRIVDRLTFWDNLLAARMADTIVAYTQDFADHSSVLSRFAPKVRVILPPVIIPDPTSEGMDALRRRVDLMDGQRVIGFAARFAYEKGAGYLINAIPDILRSVPNVRVLFAGPYGKDVIGESIWRDLQPLIERYQPYLAFLGTLNPAEMADFFALCDVVTVASINNTESFGLVQVEAFMCGTPVVATDLPGVRQPVTMTGMGEIVPTGDAAALAAGIVKVLGSPQRYVKPPAEIKRTFDLNRSIRAYEQLFEEKAAA
jgi:glycosyltransferase involved in cell wall biosynthesis